MREAKKYSKWETFSKSSQHKHRYTKYLYIHVNTLKTDEIDRETSTYTTQSFYRDVFASKMMLKHDSAIMLWLYLMMYDAEWTHTHEHTEGRREEKTTNSSITNVCTVLSI